MKNQKETRDKWIERACMVQVELESLSADIEMYANDIPECSDSWNREDAIDKLNEAKEALEEAVEIIEEAMENIEEAMEADEEE